MEGTRTRRLRLSWIWMSEAEREGGGRGWRLIVSKETVAQTATPDASSLKFRARGVRVEDNSHPS